MPSTLALAAPDAAAAPSAATLNTIANATATAVFTHPLAAAAAIASSLRATAITDDPSGLLVARGALGYLSGDRQWLPISE